MSALRGYAASISRATGVADPADLAEIEETMRHDVFHSTLDWIAPADFARGARDAWAIVQYLRSPAGKAEIAAMMGIAA
jgi:hypothetical protein